MTRLFLFAAILASAVGIAGAAGPAPFPVAKLHRADPADVDFIDLAALGEDIGDAQIVMLGEATHGDGSTFLAKAMIVKYLHEKLGFDVIAFESGLYEMHVAERRLQRGERAGAVLEDSVFPIWSTSDQFQPLIAYIQATRRSRRPLTVAGFDMQFTGEASERLPDELKALKLPGSRPALDRLIAEVAKISDYARPMQAHPNGLEDMHEDQLDRDIAELQSALSKSKRKDAAFWIQAFNSIAANLRFQKRMPEMDLTGLDIRERQMASNLNWLASKRFRDRKIIVWAATSHVMRNRRDVEVSEDKDWVPMGVYFAATPAGKRSYILGFTANEGQIADYQRRPQDIAVSPANSYEAELAAQGTETAFISLRSQDESKRVGRFLGYVPFAGKWGKALDGMIFVRTATPTTYSAHSSPISR
jgi:erythromycin esterase-like protein